MRQIIIALLLLTGVAHAQLGVGINHNTTISGTGSTASPYGVNTTLIQARVTGTCTTPAAIVAVASDGTVTCSTNAIDGTGTNNTIAKWTPDGNSLGNSLLTDDATTLNYNAGKFTVIASSGNASVAGNLAVGPASALFPLDMFTSGAGQTTATTLTDAGSRNGLAFVGDGGSSGNSGGGICFGDGASHAAGSLGFACIKGLQGNSVGNTTGDISFLTRTLGSDTSLTERMRINSAGTITMQQQLFVEGYASLDAGFSSGLDASMTSHKITSLGNGSANSDAATFGQIKSAVSGTANTTAKFTGTNVVGNGWALDDGTTWGVSSKFTIDEASGNTAIAGTLGVTGALTTTVFPIVESSTTALSIGNSQSSDVTTISGRTAQTFTGSANSAKTVTWAPVAGTTSGLAAVDAITNGTIDTTGGSKNNTAVHGTASMTKSAGGNNLVNIGGLFTASGGDANRALQTDNGDIYLAQLSGNMGVGVGVGTGLSDKLRVDGNVTLGLATTALHTLNGRIVLSSTTSTNSAISSTWTPASGTTNNVSSINATAAGTIDTTAGALSARGITSAISTTKSAGGNNLTNIAADLTSSGGDVNIALRTLAGTNYLNVTNGSTAIGVASGTAISQKLRVDGAAGGTAIAAIQTNAGQTTDSQALALLQNTGSYDTTAAGLTATGLNVIITSTRSAGANNLVNTAAILSASGAQSNRALQTQDGGVLLNSVSGVTTIGFSQATAAALTVSGQTILNSTNSANNGLTMAWTPSAGTTSSLAGIRSSVTGTFDATAGNISAYGTRSVISTSKSAGANTLTNIALYGTATNGDTNVALKTDDGAVQLNVVSGTTTLGFSNATASALTIKGQSGFTSTLLTGDALTSTWTPASGTTSGLAAVRATTNGTMDTTASQLSVTGFRAVVSTTKSAGGNSLTDIALRGDATGGDINIALQTDSGSAYLNTVAGNTCIGIASGGTCAAKLTVTGNATVSATLDVTGALNGYTQVTKPSDQDVTNSATLTDDTALTISVTAGKIYAIDALIIVGGSDTTGDYKSGWAVAAGTMDCSGFEHSLTTADAIQDTAVIATAAATTNATSIGTRADATLPIATYWSLSCKVSNTTTLKYQFAEASAVSAKVARTMAGSYLQWKQLN